MLTRRFRRPRARASAGHHQRPRGPERIDSDTPRGRLLALAIAIAVTPGALATGCAGDVDLAGGAAGHGGNHETPARDSVKPRPSTGTGPGAVRGLPPAFHALAAADDSGTVVTSFYAQARSIFTGDSPPQTGVAEETIVQERAAIVTGQILGASGDPLALAQVSVRDRPAYGETLTDSTGFFRLVVNGGEAITLDIEAAGLIAAQRSLEPPRNQSVDLGRIKLIAADVAATAIDFAGATTLQVHQASTVSDGRGERQLSLLFYPGTVATLHMPDGTTSTVDELHVTASEFTVGSDGPEAMPAEVAFGTIYTYAVEFSAAEIESAGAEHAFFNPPATLYLDNFLDIPVGAAVPAGSYNRGDTRWNGEPSGQVIELITVFYDGVNPPVIEIDLNGDGEAATPAELEALGMSAEELDYLATHYQSGDQLWRVPVQHFTDPLDLNFPGGIPGDAITPEDMAIMVATMGRCRKAGSIIECENQVLGEEIAVSDTPFSLNYRSSRVLGGPGFKLGVQYTGDEVPGSLREARVEISVAGRTLRSVFSDVLPNQHTYVHWDGRDVNGKLVQGAQSAKVCVTYAYNPVPSAQAAEGPTDLFGEWTSAGLQVPSDFGGTVELGKCYGRGVAAGTIIPGVINQANMYRLGGFLARNAAVGLGGWTLDVHHTLDPQTGTLYLGTGESREIKSKQPMAVRVAGSGLDFGLDNESVPALGIPLEPQAIAIGPDSSIYVATKGQVRHVLPDGSWVRVAGTGTPGLGAFGGVGRDTAIGMNLVGLELAPNGDLFIADQSNKLIWMLRDGVLHRVAGNPGLNVSHDIDTGLMHVSEPWSFDEELGKYIPKRSKGQGYPQDVHLKCLEDIELTPGGQGMWIVQSCGTTGDQRIRYFRLAGDLAQLDGEPWAGKHPITDEYYVNPARISHKAGWPYPDWFNVADRPVRYVGGKNPAHHRWGWYGDFGGDNLPAPAGIVYGEKWAIWKQPHSIVSSGNGTLYVAEGKGNGDVSRIRRLEPGSGTTTLGLKIGIKANEDGIYPCNSVHCNWQVHGDDGIEEAIGQLAIRNGRLYYSTHTYYNQPGVFMQGGAGKHGLPGVRVLGGGDEKLEDEQIMTPALDYRLVHPSDIEFGPDGALYVADLFGRKVVRLSTVSTSGYRGNIVASEDGAEYYVFDANGRHLSTHDSATHVPVFTFAYDDDGLLVGVTDRDGKLTQIHRDAGGAPVSIESSAGRVTTLTLDGNGYLGAIAAPSGDAHSFQYGSGGLLEGMITPEGRVHAFGYDGDGRLISDADPAGRTQTLSLIEHTPQRRVVRHTDPAGVSTDYAVEIFESEDDVKFTQTWPDGTESSRRTFSNGNVQVVDRSGAVITLEHAAHPQLGPTASYVSRVEMVAPDGGPTVAAAREILVDPACTLFDAEPCTSEVLAKAKLYADRITEITTLEAGGPVRRMMRRFTRAHSDGGSEVPAELLVVTAEERASRLVLDALGRPVRMQLGTWDGAGFVHGGLDDVTFSYHPDGRMESSQLGAGSGARVRSYGYVETAEGMTLSASSDGQEISASFDVDGWLRSVETALGVTHIDIDGDGEITGYRPPLDDWHFFKPAVDNDEASYTPAADTAIEAPISYGFRADLQMSSIDEPGVATTTMAYDGVGRLSSITSADGLLSVSYAADGRVDLVTDPAGGTLDFDYLHGALHALTRNGAETPGGPHTITWALDPVMQLGAESIDGSATIAYEYDRDGLPTAAGALAIVREAATTAVDTMDLGTVHTDVDYDARMRPTLLRYDAGGTTLYRADLSYHEDGRIESASETIGGVTTTRVYGYDAGGRLATVQVNGTPSESYVYGSYYDWSSVTRGVVNQVPAFDGQGRLAGLDGNTYGYDDLGRRVSRSGAGGNVSYLYDAESQLIQVAGVGDSVNYLYDGMQRRVAKFVDGVLARGWLYRSPYQPVAELDSSGAVVSRFVYATRTNVPDYLIRGGQTYQLVTDIRGSVRLVVEVATGAIAQRIDYDTWGRVIADTNPGFQPFGFAGGLYDPDTGLVHFAARDYDPATARFLQTDPRLFGGGYDNLHAYCAFDPVNYIDRTGEVPQWLLDGFTWADQAGIDDFIVGAGDAATLGISAHLRESIGLNDVVDECSWGYVAGEYAGAALVGGMARKLKRGPAKARKRGCFVAGTPVVTADGTVAIEDIEAGDQVACADPVSGTWATCEVEAALTREYEGELVTVEIAGDTLDATGGHPFWVIAGADLSERPIAQDAGEDAFTTGPDGARWVPARALRAGDVVLLADGSQTTVTTVASASAVTTVHNLSVAGRATYGVGALGTLVHNADYDDYDCCKRNRHRKGKSKEGKRAPPGEGFRGGKKSKRDSFFGIKDADFEEWWHMEGKDAWGGGDLTRETIHKAYENWKKLGRP